MAWRLSIVPRESGNRDQLVRRLTAAFPAIEWTSIPTLPFASPETQAAIRRRGNPVGGRLMQAQLAIDFDFVGTPELVPSIGINVRGEGDPLPTLRELVNVIDGTLSDKDSCVMIDVNAVTCAEWEALFHSLRVRIGGDYGALNPSLSQIDGLLDDIQQGRQAYGGIAVEDAAERRELSHLHVARALYAASHLLPNCWCLEFSQARNSWVMCVELKEPDELISGMFYGDPKQVWKRCLLTRDEVLLGVSYFLEHRARNPQFRWIRMREAYNLGE